MYIEYHKNDHNDPKLDIKPDVNVRGGILPKQENGAV